MGFNLPLLNRRRRGIVFSPLSLFASGEEGAWYEPSTTTCFTDTGGTVAATYGDGVAYLQDLSGNGNHATQTTASARPILARVPEGGRRNLLEKTEQFDDAYYTKTEASITVNAASAPNGTVTADKLVEGSGTVNPRIARTVNSTGTHTFSVYAKAAERSFVRLFYFTQSDAGAYFDLSTGTRTSTQEGSFYVNSEIFDAGDGWYRCSLTVTGTSAIDSYGIGVSAADGQTSRTGDGTSGIYIWGAQLEAGSTATAYQKVVDEYDVTEAGVTSLEYLAFDGSDDGMATASLDFTGVTVIDMFAGVDVVQGTNRAAIFARYAGDNTDLLGFEAPSTNTNQWGGIIRTGNSTAVFTSAYSHPQKAVLTITHDPASRQLRVDGTQTANQVAPSGGNDIISGVYGVGYRAGTLNDLPFDGKIFGLIVRGASSTTGEISNTEAYLANRSGVTLP